MAAYQQLLNGVLRRKRANYFKLVSFFSVLLLVTSIQISPQLMLFVSINCNRFEIVEVEAYNRKSKTLLPSEI